MIELRKCVDCHTYEEHQAQHSRCRMCGEPVCSECAEDRPFLKSYGMCKRCAERVAPNDAADIQV